ncbi:hypothetical protein [Noviherbaspirillum galbum]|uniref:Uncharacterized protein n=1 Tax=Noviherbaspirillum galbum TaxID=2709383 RepID=A0A6B3SSQ4_9BURK|nr:hypothetical protein [Noviherbaspirillum galbum]NEX63990.1 hypothetical protein [Noviherbaspirillum galbum]
MERFQAGQVGKTQPTIHPRRAISSLVSRKRKLEAAKLTRQQVSDCINIWAQVYQLRDADDASPGARSMQASLNEKRPPGK